MQALAGGIAGGELKICSIPNCGRHHRARGLCNLHWQRWSTGRSLTAPVQQKRPLRRTLADERAYERAYLRRYKHGQVAAQRRTPTEPRFWAKVNKDGPVPAHRPDLGACWLYTGSKYKYGYGFLWVSELGRQISAARYSWELANGPSDPMLDILHHCDNPPCVRAAHLWQGTHSDNMRDCYAKRRHPKAKNFAT